MSQNVPPRPGKMPSATGFELAESTDNLVYVDEWHGTRATLDTRHDLIWSQHTALAMTSRTVTIGLSCSGSA